MKASIFNVDDFLSDDNETPKESPNESSKKPAKESPNESPKKPYKKKSLNQSQVSVKMSDTHTNVQKLVKEINDSLNNIQIFTTPPGKRKKPKEIVIPKIKLIYPTTAYDVEGTIYTVISNNDKKRFNNNITDVRSVIFANENKIENSNDILGKIDELTKEVEKYKNTDEVKKALNSVSGGEIVEYKEKAPKEKAHKDKAQMTVNDYIDELAQLDAFTVPEEKLKEGLNNAIDSGIIGLDKKKVDSAVDAIYSKSLLFNKKLKKLLEDANEEELLEKIPPEVLKRINKLRSNKQDIKNRKYKLFKKPPTEPHTESPATIPPHERDYQPPYGLNPLLLRGVRVLVKQ